MYILLEFYNDYDQHGGYFAGVFDTKEAAELSVDHIGRKDYEYHWYEVIKADINKLNELVEE